VPFRAFCCLQRLEISLFGQIPTILVLAPC
jgi:hypothetical protein